MLEKKFAEYVKECRKKKELSQSEFANGLGISRSQLANMEKGRSINIKHINLVREFTGEKFIL